jgi:hypothetical protein
MAVAFIVGDPGAFPGVPVRSKLFFFKRFDGFNYDIFLEKNRICLFTASDYE